MANLTIKCNWGDLLTEYNGQTIEYDNIGNPLYVKNGDTVVKSYTWTQGRQMASYTNNGVTWTYTYDANGMRTGRTDGTNTYEYIYAGDKLVRMVYNGEAVDISYAGSQPLSLTYDGATYYYVLNGQGDGVALVDGTGTMIVGYHYSAYGNPVLLKTDYAAYTDLKCLNPFLYRGYVYDIESSLYYLQSRYYDPELGRFINADAYASTGQSVLGNNMFAYCLNNPANNSDPSGELTVAEGLKAGIGLLPLLDGPIPIGDVITVIIIGALFFNDREQAMNKVDKVTASSINWEGGDKNHILKGTWGSHINGWKRFGIDPDDNNAWAILLPILKEVVEKADRYVAHYLPNGAMYIKYFKTYVDQGVEVMVKIWIDASGTIQQISDVIPYVIGN